MGESQPLFEPRCSLRQATFLICTWPAKVLTLRAVHAGGEDPELSAAFMKTSMAACLLLRSTAFSPRLPLLLSAALLMAGCGGGTSAPQGGPSGVPQISVNPASVSFGNVSVGSSGSQTIVITNTGGAGLTLSQTDVSGGFGFSTRGLTSPLTLAPGQSTSFSVIFAPQIFASDSGILSVGSNAVTSPTLISLSGTGAQRPSGVLTVDPSSIAFGGVSLGLHSTRTVTLTNTGVLGLTIPPNILTSTAFSVSGLSLPLSLAPGQSASFAVQFAPNGAGMASDILSLASDAANSPTSIVLGGNGLAPPPHSVTLSWDGSSQAISGYLVYRANVPGGPYTPLTTAPVAAPSFTDSTAAGGQTYSYVVTAITDSRIESLFSNKISVTVPPL